MPEEDQERTRIQRASAGDRVSATLLLTSVRPMLLERVTRRIPAMLSGIVEAEDLVQEALAIVLRTLPRFQWRGPGSFQRWAATIAINKLRDWARVYRALQHAPAGGPGNDPPSGSYVQLLDSLAGSEHTPSRSFARLEAATALHTVLAELPGDQRRAIELVYLEGRPVTEVAAELGRSEHAVHQLCSKARERMRALLGDATRFLSGTHPKPPKP